MAHQLTEEVCVLRNEVLNENVEKCNVLVKCLLGNRGRTGKPDGRKAMALAGDRNQTAKHPEIASVPMGIGVATHLHKMQLPGFSTIVAACILSTSWMAGVGLRFFVTIRPRPVQWNDDGGRVHHALEWLDDTFCKKLDQEIVIGGIG